MEGGTRVRSMEGVVVVVWVVSRCVVSMFMVTPSLSMEWMVSLLWTFVRGCWE